MLSQSLRKIGLSEKEIKVYLNALQLGSQPASVIAHRVELNRSTVYDVFASLIKKGLASKTEVAGTTYFQVLDPKNLVNYLEREKVEYVKQKEKDKQAIEALLPVLKSLENPLSTKPKVQYFEGERGMREAYEDTLTAKEEILAYANPQTMHEGLPNFFPEYYARRSEAGIHIKAISPNNALSVERHKHDQQELREMVLVPAQEYSFAPEMNIYDDKIIIASWTEKIAILIQSQEIADLHKKIYKLAWDRAKKLK